MSLLTNLVWWWDLSAATATITDQQSGLTLTSDGNNPPTLNATGGPDGGPCLTFSQSRYRATVPRTIDYNAAFSANIWVRSTGTSSVFNGAMMHRNQAAQWYWQISTRGSGLDSGFGGDAASAYRNPTNTAGALNTWQMLTLVNDATSMRLYRNAGLVATDSTTLGLRNTQDAAFAIGGQSWLGQIDTWHIGQLAMAGVWSKGLTESELSQLYNSGVGRRYSALADVPQTRRRRQSVSGGVL
jgi:hypothetical protein